MGQRYRVESHATDYFPDPANSKIKNFLSAKLIRSLL